jgi:hypothetical protein
VPRIGQANNVARIGIVQTSNAASPMPGVFKAKVANLIQAKTFVEDIRECSERPSRKQIRADDACAQAMMSGVI